MKIVCEVVVQDILPALRAAIARELITDYNLNQGETAKLLDVSQPAVSQYLRQLRGKNSWIDNDFVVEEIKKICSSLQSKEIGPAGLSTRMCEISRTIIEKGLIKGDFHAVDSCVVCK